jgi:hypothetical protein
MANNDYSNVKAVVEVSSDVSQSCKICDYYVKHDAFEEGVNHYINVHDFQLLFVGGRTLRGDDGKPWATTVAILGSSAAIVEKSVVSPFSDILNKL